MPGYLLPMIASMSSHPDNYRDAKTFVGSSLLFFSGLVA
jgi:hypothetical protein